MRARARPVSVMGGLDADGWLVGARLVPSPNCDDRPPGMDVDLVVIHSISLPPGEFGGDAIERLFTNRLDADAHPYFGAIASLRVAAHFLVRRDGELVQFVPCEKRAWHAGESSWRGRGRCNDYSIGIELEGCDERPFEPEQYEALERLIVAVRARYPIRECVGHCDVAPARKTDPGPRFDWSRVPLPHPHTADPKTRNPQPET